MSDDLDMAQTIYGCCEHCVEDPPHTGHRWPCAEGCNDAEATS